MDKMEPKIFSLKSKERSPIFAVDLIDRTPLWHPSFPFVILWSQKAACTSVIKWFFHQIGRLEEALAFNPWIHEYENRVFKKKENYKRELAKAINGGIPIYQFVRDPYARAYSQYTITLLPVARTDSSHFAFKARAEISQQLFGEDCSPDRPFSFSQFLSWLEHAKMSELDPHFRPQRLLRDEKMSINVVKIESLAGALESLTNKYSLRPMGDRSAEILDSGHHSKKINDLSTAEILRSLEEASQLSANVRNQIPRVTQASIAGSLIGKRVRKIFGSDIQMYGYDK